MRRRRTQRQTQRCSTTTTTAPAEAHEASAGVAESSSSPPSSSSSSQHQQEQQASLFFTPNGGLRFPMVLLLAAVAMAWQSRWGIALLVLVVGLGFALCQAMNEQLEFTEKQDIRYNIMEAEDVVHEMAQVQLILSSTSQEQQQPEQTDRTSGFDRENIIRQGKVIVLSGLGALAKKYGKQTSLLKKADSHTSSDVDDGNKFYDPSISREEYQRQQMQQRKQVLKQQHHKRLLELAVISQRAAYIGFRLFPEHDPIVAASLSLLALVAKQPIVREKHFEQADKFGLDLPIQCLQKALERAKEVPVVDDENRNNNNTITQKIQNFQGLSLEQQSAELQRKGCLLLGALSDGDATMAQLVAQEGGIQAILDAVDWYRYHSQVANWALWALFTLCSEYSPNKAVFIESNGISIVIRALRNCVDTLEVVRHGFVLLFDLMREQQDGDDVLASPPRLDVWRIRNTALNEGVHEVVVQGMEQHCYEMQVIMMGQAILMGTEYKGDFPEYQPTK